MSYAIRIMCVGALLVLSAACGARTEISMESVELSRPSWDSLVVDVAFSRQTSLGRPSRFEPDSVKVVAHGAMDDTLFSGRGPGFSFPDHRLGDREGVILDVCGAARGTWICEQMGMRASPKYILAEAEIDFPTDSEFRRGRYTITPRVERESVGGETREPIRSEMSPAMLIEAFVDGSEQARVRVPVSRTNGTFDLSRQAEYAEFRFHLDSELMDHDEATVHFLIYAGFEYPSDVVARVERRISPVTPEDREVNVQGFVRQAARILVSDLASFLGGRRTAAYLLGWHYDPTQRRYAIEMEMRWRGSFFDQRDYVLQGTLQVGEDGRGAVFNLDEGNRAGLERWERRYRAPQRALGDLNVVAPQERYRPGARRPGSGSEDR